jgi:AraC-like DNA-binding protein
LSFESSFVCLDRRGGRLDRSRDELFRSAAVGGRANKPSVLAKPSRAGNGFGCGRNRNSEFGGDTSCGPFTLRRQRSHGQSRVFEDRGRRRLGRAAVEGRLGVEAAQRLLSESRLPVKRIAQRCGFGSEETMRRSFHRLMNITPQDFRARFGSWMSARKRSSVIGRMPKSAGSTPVNLLWTRKRRHR